MYVYIYIYITYYINAYLKQLYIEKLILGGLTLITILIIDVICYQIR
jgi:hypothetical protein